MHRRQDWVPRRATFSRIIAKLTALESAYQANASPGYEVHAPYGLVGRCQDNKLNEFYAGRTISMWRNGTFKI